MHDLVLGATIYFEKNLSPGAEWCLMWCYEQSPCSMCRGGAVRSLLEIGTLPEWMREECRYDCYSVTREAVG